MQKKNNSLERKKYLRKNTITKASIIVTQVTILVAFIILWEVLANKGIIDSFITSQPSRMLKTFMNLSGECVRAALDFYKISPDNLIIIYDDISLDVGRLRVRRDGSAGGHNGIKSILEHLGTKTFPRIKVGVGQKPHPDYDLASWVLSEFKADELKALEGTFPTVCEGLEKILTTSIDDAMQICNKKQ